MREKADIRVSEIIDAAISEFLDKGYENASMESIARAAKLSKGGLYHHFSSKVDILFAVNLKILEPIQDLMKKIAKNPSLINGLKEFVSDYIVYWEQHRREITLYFFTMNISFSNDQLIAYYSEFAHREFACFEAYFALGQQLGIFKPRNARAHATAFISCMDGYLAYMLIDPEFSVNKVIAEIQETFITDFMIHK